jgi:membrane-associated protease RseP (regulator of RpoE activity)
MDQAAEVESIRSTVAKQFIVYDVRASYDSVSMFITPDKSVLEVRFEELRKEMASKGYIPILEYKGGEYQISVVRKPPSVTRRPWINLMLLVITAGTTIFAGAFLWAGYNFSDSLMTVDNFLYGSLFFALPLLTILGVHELSHYIMSKRYGIDASLPYFIPSVPPLGTFGAFISMRDPMPNKKALVDIGFAGPLGGLLVTIPVAIIGLILNAQGIPHPGIPPGGQTVISNPIFYELMAYLIPSPEGVYIHPTAFAAWVGFFVTAINLLPAGQLDGGHIARGLLGDKAMYLSIGTIMVLFVLGIFYSGWFLFALLIVFLGVRHPAPLNDVSRLDAKRTSVGIVSLLLLVGCFVLVPLSEVPVTDTFEIDLVSDNSTTLAAGSMAFFYFNVTNTGSVNITVQLDVHQMPSNWSAVLFEADQNSSDATSTLIISIPYASNVTVAMRIAVPAGEPPSTKVLVLQGSSTDTKVSKQLTISVA